MRTCNEVQTILGKEAECHLGPMSHGNTDKLAQSCTIEEVHILLWDSVDCRQAKLLLPLHKIETSISIDVVLTMQLVLGYNPLKLRRVQSTER